MIAASRDFRQLRLDGVSRDFGSLNALRDVTLKVGRGEFIALLGPSGCGKSTALNCLAGLLPLTGGSIWLDDARIDRLKPEGRGFGMVFQNYALFPHMSVRKNIGFGLKMQGRPKAESERPLSNLDAKLRLEMRAEIRRIHTLVGSTTIYVTHDQDEALSLADRIVVLRDGMVRQVGTPAELYARPAHADVAEFMGYRNLVPSRAFASGNGTMSVTVAGAAIKGTPLETLADGPVTVAIRPDDLTPRAEGPIVATVATAEYRGRDFYGTATAGDDTELFFRSEQKVAPGEVLALGADAPRVLIYAGAPA